MASRMMHIGINHTPYSFQIASPPLPEPPIEALTPTELSSDSPPLRMLCPIGLEIMTDPVYLKCRHIFERANLVAHLNLKPSERCALCRSTFTRDDLQKHQALTKQIILWKKHNSSKKNVAPTLASQAAPPPRATQSLSQIYRALVTSLLPPWIIENPIAREEAIFLIQWESEIHFLLKALLDKSANARFASDKTPLELLFKNLRFPLVSQKNLSDILCDIYKFVFYREPSSSQGSLPAYTETLGKEIFYHRASTSVRQSAIVHAVLTALAKLFRFREVLQLSCLPIFDQLPEVVKKEIYSLTLQRWQEHNPRATSICTGEQLFRRTSTIHATEHERAIAIERYTSRAYGESRIPVV